MFKSYGVKSKLTSQCANQYSLTSRKRQINACVCYIGGLRTMITPYINGTVERPWFEGAALEDIFCRFCCKYLFQLAISTRLHSERCRQSWLTDGERDRHLKMSAV